VKRLLLGAVAVAAAAVALAFLVQPNAAIYQPVPPGRLRQQQQTPD
jgi:hypothetical protein